MKKQLAFQEKRYMFSLIGLFVLSLGVALTKKSGLGVTPISSLANVLSIRFPGLTLGNWMIVCNCTLVAAQLLLLRRKFTWLHLLQVPVSFLFGYYTDFWVFLMSPVGVEGYLSQLLLLLLGSGVVGLGISIMVIANALMNIGESFVKTLSDMTCVRFSTMKTLFDVACVALAAALSLVFFDFRLQGIREGTVMIAGITGWISGKCVRLLEPSLNQLLFENGEK